MASEKNSFKKIIVKFTIIITILFCSISLSFSYDKQFNMLYDSTIINYEQGNYRKAKELGENALNIIDESSNLYNESYHNCLYNLSQIYYCLKDVNSSYIYAQKDSIESLKIYGKSHPEYAKSLVRIGWIYTDKGYYSEAEAIINEAMDIVNSTLGDEHPEYAKTSFAFAYLKMKSYKYEESEELMLESLGVLEENIETNTEEYYQYSRYLGILYSYMKRYNEAEKILFSLRDYYQSEFGKNSIYYNDILHKLAILYYQKEQYWKSEEILLDLTQSTYINESVYYRMTILFYLGQVYLNQGRFDNSKKYQEQYLALSKEHYGINSQRYANALNNLSSVYYLKNDYIKAIELLEEAIEIHRQIKGFDDLDYAIKLTNLGIYYADFGRKDEAEKYLQNSSQIVINIKGERSFEYLNNLYYLSEIYYWEKRYVEAIVVSINALEIAKTLFGEESGWYANILGQLGRLYLHTENSDKAEELLTDAIQIEENVLGKNNAIYANSLSWLGYYYQLKENYDEAEKYLTESLEIFQGIYGNNHPRVLTQYSNLARLYSRIGSLQDAEPYFNSIVDISMNLVQSYFPHLSERNKLQFWNDKKWPIDFFNDFATKYSTIKPEILKRMFDINIATKGLIVNSKKRALQQARSTQRTLEDWVSASEMWVHYVQNPDKASRLGIDIDSLEREKFSLEKELSEKSTGFKRAFDTTNITWLDIRNKLKNNEASVEIIRFLSYDKFGSIQDTNYIALVIKKESEQPELIKIENGNLLEDKYIYEYKNMIKTARYGMSSDLLTYLDGLYQVFWEPINEYLKGVKTVYIAPDGVYNQINLNILYNLSNSKYVIEEIDLRLLTNSKDIMLFERYKNNEHNNDALLMGNPAFNLSNDEVSTDSMSTRYYLSLLFRNISESGITMLPGSEVEIDSLSSVLRKNKWKVDDYLGTDAVESVIKNVRGPKILHFATHGIFLKDVEEIVDALPVESQQKAFIENPLLRSMLLLAGSENTIKGQTIKDEDDGILTAYEVMNLDLDNTELVVLSACETGLGKVRNGEGVYGMQRAFQIAGAKSLIMSLWKVNDQTTKELMILFYTNWLSGMSKRVAFRMAQLMLKEKYSNYYLWGAFIMVGE